MLHGRPASRETLGICYFVRREYYVRCARVLVALSFNLLYRSIEEVLTQMSTVARCCTRILLVMMLVMYDSSRSSSSSRSRSRSRNNRSKRGGSSSSGRCFNMRLPLQKKSG